jgi:hypothetical protein
MHRQNRLRRVVAQPNLGAAPGIPPNRQPSASHRMARLARWMVELVESRLVEDAILIAALESFEAALVAHLDTRP